MIRVVLLLCLFAVPSISQTTAGASTTGPCSPANTAPNSIFTIDCGIGQEQGQKMLDILNKILSNQLDPNVVMAKLDEILKALNPYAPVITYSLNGGKHIRQGNDVSIEAGVEFAWYQQVLAPLYEQSKWQELLAACEKQILKAPDWPTPHMFAGIALANLGRKSEAIVRLRFVNEKTAGDPEYSDAGRILRLLESQ